MELPSIVNIISVRVMMDLNLIRNRGLGLELKCSTLIFFIILTVFIANQALEMWMDSSWIEIGLTSGH